MLGLPTTGNVIADAVEGGMSGLGNMVKQAVGAFKADPTKELEFEAAIQKAATDYATAAITSVNATMQAESKSEHFLQFAWRPIFGLTGAGILVNNYILLPYFSKLGIVPIVVPMEVWLLLTAVLGVAAWTRGTEKVARINAE